MGVEVLKKKPHVLLSSSGSEDLSEKENTPPTESTPLPSEIGHQSDRNERIADWLENQPDITIKKLPVQAQEEQDEELEELLVQAQEQEEDDNSKSGAG